MALILSINTSTRNCSVALHQGDNLLACYELISDKSSSGMLTTLVQNIAQQAGFELRQIDAFAIAKGPGSYTGLRIGVSTAKGLCFALDKPLIAVHTLEAMALQVQDFVTDALLCPMIDARRMEVYAAIFDQNLEYKLATQAKIIDSESFVDFLETQKIVFFGDGAAKCQATLTHRNAVFLPHIVHPSASSMGKLVANAWDKQAFEDIAAFEPFYLKDFIATTPRKLV
jgi:tRNA threonylcarbamoyladenosine biosynthesis protein TsaB